MMGLADSELQTCCVTDAPLDAAKLWTDVLECLRVRVGREGFETWLAPTRGCSVKDGLFDVEVPNAFFADWIGHHYAVEVKAALATVTGYECAVSFRPKGTNVPGALVSRRAPAPRPTLKSDSYRLRSRYTFDAFVVGESNRLACAAARSVAERPGSAYNPLFIYGGVGLGKTHLIQAIGNHALALQPGMRVYYTAADWLFIELIQAIEKNTRLEFKNKYTGLDLLLLDDVHYLVGKERLQEEVFYIFNSLHDAGSQVVFTCDRPPQEIPTLEQRLASRLGQGLVVDIQAPELETRIAILKQKSAADNFDLPDDVTYFIAARVRSSVRQLEGCLTRLAAFSSLDGRPITVQVAEEALKDLIKDAEPPDHNRIIAACANQYGLRVQDVTGDRRTKQVALARQVAMYLMRAYLKLSLKEIGFHFGDRDHTTVMHAIEKVTELRVKDPSFAMKLDKLAKEISGGEAR
jgi:chromosomal replication initiator protein